MRVVFQETVFTLAGLGASGSLGDGGQAFAATILGPQSLAFDRQGNLYVSDTGHHRIRKILATRPAFSPLLPDNLEFLPRSGGAPPSAQGLIFSASVAGLSFSSDVSTSSGGDWLRANRTAGRTPARVEIMVDPANLPAGEYEGKVAISIPDADPTVRELAVQATVTAAIAPKLGVDRDSMSFNFPLGSSPRSETFPVSNQGSGSLEFTAAAATDSGGDWLTVPPNRGTTTAAASASVHVTASPGELPASTYTGRILLASPSTGETQAIAVTMTVSSIGQAMLLSHTGLSFTTVAGGGAVPPQSFGVLALGRGSMNWSALTSTLSGGPWLAASPDRGTSNPTKEAALVEVRVDQTGLEPGGYYGLVTIEAAGAANTPQVVTVFLDVLPPGSDPGPVVAPNELIFSSVAGGDSPSSQDVFAYNITSHPKSFRSVRSTDAGGGWLLSLPNDATLEPQRPSRIVVQPLAEGLPPGVYRGKLALRFSDGRVREVTVVFVLRASSAEDGSFLSKAQQTCLPTKLLPAMRTLRDDFSVSASWPIALEVEVQDDCGRPLKTGAVGVEFSNGDPPLAMTSLKNGRCHGTWQTNPKRLSAVTVKVEAELPELGIRGTRELSGRLLSIQEPPVLISASVVSAASFQAHVPLAPGSLISIFGQRLSEGRGMAEGLPLKTTMAGTTVIMASQPMPLLFTSDGQVNAIVPYELTINTRHQLLLQRGPTYARPVSVDVAAAQPAVFKPDSTIPQGHIYKFVDASTQVLAGPENPVEARDAIIIYCSGLGAVAPAVKAGMPTPFEEPLARTVNPVSVMIGGMAARVLFSGLAPGFSGLDQVNGVIPEAIPAGEEVPVVLSVAGQNSPRVTIAVR